MVNEDAFTNYTCSIDKDAFDKPIVSKCLRRVNFTKSNKNIAQLVLYTSGRCTRYCDSEKYANSSMVRST